MQWWSFPPEKLITLDLAFAEVANVVWKNVITSGEQEEVAFRALHGCMDFIGIACEVMSAAYLLEDAFRIALSERLTVYDALYLAASRRSGAPLFTMDRVLSEKTKGRWVRDLCESPRRMHTVFTPRREPDGGSLIPKVQEFAATTLYLSVSRPGMPAIR
ncbi:MAG: type II toxin-antitoxin system VapC family toxin [Methanolinea sp.]|nr:type II toxin-antitoxin system VapC family toxin [Methanolinea sp.]